MRPIVFLSLMIYCILFCHSVFAQEQHFTDESSWRLPDTAVWSLGADVGDIDGDGDYDICVATEVIFTVGNCYLLINDGQASFACQSDIRFPPDGYDSNYCEFGDADWDGDLDLYICNTGFAPANFDRLYINNGLGFFLDQQSRIPVFDNGTPDARFADFTGDFLLDILVEGHDNYFEPGTRLLANDGAGYFSDITLSHLPPDMFENISCILIDIDNDLDLDIIEGNYDNDAYPYYIPWLLVNIGEGYFSNDFQAQIPGSTLRFTFPGDIDADGDLDIFISCTGDGRQKLFINHSTPDTISPNILMNTIYEENVDSADYYAVHVSAWDNISVALGELTGKLRYRINNGEYVELELLPLGGTIFGERIPGQPSGTRVDYYIKMLDRMGNITYAPATAPDSVYTFWVEEITGMDEDELLPEKVEISVYPNPFNSRTIITIKDSRGGDVEIGIYDIQGRLIRELYAGNVQGGDKKAVWDARDNSGRRVSSGIYFARVGAGNFTSVKKILYLR